MKTNICLFLAVVVVFFRFSNNYVLTLAIGLDDGAELWQKKNSTPQQLSTVHSLGTQGNTRQSHKIQHKQTKTNKHTQAANKQNTSRKTSKNVAKTPEY